MYVTATHSPHHCAEPPHFFEYSIGEPQKLGTSSGKRSLSRSNGRIFSRALEASTDSACDDSLSDDSDNNSAVSVTSIAEMDSNCSQRQGPQLQRQNAMSKHHYNEKTMSVYSDKSEKRLSDDHGVDDRAGARGSGGEGCTASWQTEGKKLSGLRQFSKEELMKAFGSDSCQKIGSGSFGDVYSMEFQGERVAIKRVKALAWSLDRFRREVSILASLDHPKVVKFIGCCTDPEFPAIVMEHMMKGSLSDNLERSNIDRFHWSMRFSVFCDICEGLDFLHSRTPTVIHCDLKPQNILLNKHAAKIGDTGLAREIYLGDDSYVQQSQAEGTLTYADPEFVRFGILGPCSDVYSLGWILVDILFGMGGEKRFLRRGNFFNCVKEAVEAENTRSVLGLVDVSGGNWPEDLTAKLLEMMIWCTEYKRENRPSLQKNILPLCRTLREEVDRYRKQSEEEKRRRLDEERSRNYFCPITQDLMKHPVVAADGYCYEREAIEKWLLEKDTSPMTNLPLEHKILNPSNHMNAEIREYLESNRT